MTMAISQDVTTPKLAQAGTATEEDIAAKQKAALASLDADAWAEEIRNRRGLDGIKALESRLGFVGEHTGWTRRWCNDDADSIPRRLADGWRFVQPSEVHMSESVGMGNGDIGDRVSVVSNIGDGRAIKVYLMEIPTVIAEEILEVRSYSKVRAFEDSLRAGSVGISDTTRTYNPGTLPGSAYYKSENKVGQGAQNT